MHHGGIGEIRACLHSLLSFLFVGVRALSIMIELKSGIHAGVAFVCVKILVWSSVVFWEYPRLSKLEANLYL
jgi:hypothetical protein